MKGGELDDVQQTWEWTAAHGFADDALAGEYAQFLIDRQHPEAAAAVWRQRLGGHFAASPIYADGRLYFCNQEGKATMIKPGRSYELLATNTLESGCMASPAVSGKALFLRTKTHLYRIESHGQNPD